ncbi:hypothetical protein GCM10010840_07900 [Deinococcus aerolatus]|uniref:DUF899 domain-containing protein n=2 Tax=Deinococcus aerolatus TaxID=522487 RepID=A0ABQ2G326_9DEIO|nr:hypothetical protein GCM10010840_07900 [Deinococcus aerolatus]
MSIPGSAHPPIVDRASWQRRRDAILNLEKAATRLSDSIATQRRFLPMTEVENYVFMGEDGPITLTDLFGGRPQLIVHHFMFQPEWERGCPACTYGADNSKLHLPTLHAADISFVRISRAPIEKLQAYGQEKGWDVPWYSSFSNTFNRDWGWTGEDGGERPGYSAFLMVDGRPYLTYSTSGRGVENLIGIYGYLDIVPYGRQEAWQDVPEGWPQS